MGKLMGQNIAKGDFRKLTIYKCHFFNYLKSHMYYLALADDWNMNGITCVLLQYD